MSDVEALLSTLEHERTQRARFEPQAWRLRPAVATQIRDRWDRRIEFLEQSLRDAGYEVLPEVRPEPLRSAVLVLDEGGASERAVPLTGEVVHLGRGRDVDLKLSDGRASRIHCRLVQVSPDRWDLEDLGSANGTLINGELFTSATRRLYGGEEIIIGETFLRFRLLD
jgi:hypothetical protein